MYISEEHALNELEKNLKELVSTDQGRRAFIISVPLLLTGCSSRSKHRHREGDNKGQKTAMSVEDEKRMSREYLPQMRKEYPTHPSREAQRYIATLGNKIVMANGLHAKPYTYNFTVVKAGFVNAFALPAGTVMVTAPLLAMADSEAELAGVVGHEIGHVKARHTAERMEQQKKESTKSILYGLGGALLGGAAGFGLGKLLCKKGDKGCMARAALYGGLAGTAGGLLIQKFAFMANSREDEMEADRIGFRTSVNAGYHKDHVGSFYTKLLSMEKNYKRTKNQAFKPFADAMSTHPPSEERVRQMHIMASRASLGPKTITNTDQFMRVKQILKRG